jgi:hypothetical protein
MNLRHIFLTSGVLCALVLFGACLPAGDYGDDETGGGVLVDENGRELQDYSEDEFVPKMFTDNAHENDACANGGSGGGQAGGCPDPGGQGGCPDPGQGGGQGGCPDPGGQGGGCPDGGGQGGGCPDPGPGGGNPDNGGGDPGPGGNPDGGQTKSLESCQQACYNLVTCIQDMCPIEVLSYFSDDVIAGCTQGCLADPNWRDPGAIANASCGDISAGICQSMPVVDAFCDCSGGAGGNGGEEPPPPRK